MHPNSSQPFLRVCLFLPPPPNSFGSEILLGLLYCIACLRSFHIYSVHLETSSFLCKVHGWFGAVLQMVVWIFLSVPRGKHDNCLGHIFIPWINHVFERLPTLNRWSHSGILQCCLVFENSILRGTMTWGEAKLCILTHINGATELFIGFLFP